LKNLKKITFASLLISLIFLISANGQERSSVVKQVSSQPVNQPSTQPTFIDKTKTLSSSAPVNTSQARPPLTNKIEIAQAPQPLVKKTGSTSPLSAMSSVVAGKVLYNAVTSSILLKSIQEKIGIPYRYGSEGPDRYDCSGFVWAVFNQAGILFERTSARSLWTMSEQVDGDERFKFGTLVFFNSLGHIGIVADENGFYQASSSKGITYSPFAGYWQKRIVGFRRLIPAKQ
jgi:cell wall-associated NlpC family hydrolase